MANNLKNPELRRVPKAFSIDDETWFKFKEICYNNHSTPSRELQLFILKYLKRYK